MELALFGAFPYVIDEFVVLAVIVELVVVIRRQYHANCSRREIINLPPYHWAYIETIVTAVHMYGFFRVPDNQKKNKQTKQNKNKKKQFLMRVTTTLCAPGYIV